jgi:uncharacterized membrane protein
VSRDTTRLVTFSDGVFAITITLLVLEIRPPTDERNLLHGLLALWPSYLAYALTFLFIGQVWADHHVTAHRRSSLRRLGTEVSGDVQDIRTNHKDGGT